MKLFFFDTETSGLPDFRAPSEAKHQPHIVQVAAALVDADSRQVLASIDLVVRPTDWVIPDEVAAVHGITTERARDIGVSERLAIESIYALWQLADRRIAHNEAFDQRIVRIGLKRFATEHACDQWGKGAVECTAAMSTQICALPPTPKMVKAGFNHFKTPKLSEAHQILLGEPLQNAHSALADVDGCRRIYFHLKDREAAAIAA